MVEWSVSRIISRQGVDDCFGKATKGQHVISNQNYRFGKTVVNESIGTIC